ncbi:MAG: hypothetical protein K0R63_1857 [Rickettsiales bacterium]|nr:hypothetical protein [Rickettsiales bacterium]
MEKPLENSFSSSQDAIPLGTPLPASAHAVSVSLPAWADVVGYEEGEPRVVNAMQLGYPRFVYHPSILKLCEQVKARYAREAEECLVFPSAAVARDAASYIQYYGEGDVRILPAGYDTLYAVCFKTEDARIAKQFWQHAGMIVSSRLADAALSQKPPLPLAKTKLALSEHLASLLGQSHKDVYLFPSGMGAIYTIHKAVCTRLPQARTIQLGFPYIDMLKIQERWGLGVHYLPYNSAADLETLGRILASEPIAGVFCEFPGNPLLQSVDLAALSEILRRYDVPLIVDDTIATFANVDVSAYADVVVTSLTKFYSGKSDVLAGAAVLSARSPLAPVFRDALNGIYEDLLFEEDALVLLENGRDFETRMHQINETAERLCDAIHQHPAVARLYYPKYVETASIYEVYKKPKGGYGGLFSLELEDPALAPIFYDRLQIAKGPSLGANFTLACPYTLLAHYQELNFAKASGVASHLIRVSVGLEMAEGLVEHFKEVLNGLT